VLEPVSGNSARYRPEQTMPQLSLSIESSLLVRDVAGEYRPANADEVLQAAQRLLGAQLRGREVLTSPQAVRDFLRVKLGALEHEVFAVLMLDAQNRLIDCVELFRGTLTQTSVYPREVVKLALQRNAAGLIFAHNHPSGDLNPSDADRQIHEQLTQAAKILGIRVLDHIIVTKTGHYSFQAAGQIRG